MSGKTETFNVAIAGGGPAGTSAAIHLANAGARVLLVEEKKFPRPKLCGEFISPECLEHFSRLGVDSDMEAAGGTPLLETVFYSRRGRSLQVPSEWFAHGSGRANALGLSRSVMDHQLMQRAKQAGVSVKEERHATPIMNKGVVKGLRLKAADSVEDCEAHVTIDATGRGRLLARQVEPENHNRKRPKLVAFKAHLENARQSPTSCEIYSYPGGYGGLSRIEDGLSNLCFIVAAEKVRRLDSDPERVLSEILMSNRRARYTLGEARVASEWLSVSLNTFGRANIVPANGLLAVGDAASFIDPFTGSGMLMALENGETAARVISAHLPALRASGSFESLAAEYREQYLKQFDSRLRAAAWLRRAAFIPNLADAAILFFGASRYFRKKIAQATRRSNDRELNANRQTFAPHK